MEQQEKKYLVNSFTDIERKLQDVDAQIIKQVVSTHYYGQHEGNDVEKFVEYADRVEIHTLKESNGQFTMTGHRPISDKLAGFAWLKNRGYKTANIVKMDYTEYTYKNGTVGLYTIDDALKSVILYYPPNEHAPIENEFGLGTAEVIAVPYNKYLDRLGKLRSITI